MSERGERLCHWFRPAGIRWIANLTGDPPVYGRVYLGTGGRGIVYGEPLAK